MTSNSIYQNIAQRTGGNLYILSNSEDLLLAKNSYQLKFNNNISLFDEPKGTTWRMMPNLNDLTFIHNQLAFFMGKMSKLDYTPRAHHVDMFMNGRFFGNYVMTERPELTDERMNIGNDGIILNSESVKFSSVWFSHSVVSSSL